MGPPFTRRAAVIELENILVNNFPKYNHIIHDASIPLPEYVKKIEWNCILFGSTFLCKVLHPKELKSAKIEYEWIKDSNAIKIALPQDDYNCSEILDNLFDEWQINYVFSVLSKHHEILYPKFLKRNQIKLAYTGYISNNWIKKWNKVKIFKDREIDVSYRASKLAEYYGKTGYLKGKIGDIFIKAVAPYNLNTDISTNPEDVIPGEKWHDFIENSKFCLTTPSGSSIHDPRGEIREKVKNYKTKFPNSSFNQVEESCFSELDSKFVFTAISPRNLEAGMAKTVQIATKGNYSNIMKPLEDFIPIAENCEDINEVMTFMNDKLLIQKISNNFKEKILSLKSLRLENFALEILDLAFENKVKYSDQDKNLNLIKKYNLEFPLVAKKFWEKFYFKQKIKDELKKTVLKDAIAFFKKTNSRFFNE